MAVDVDGVAGFYSLSMFAVAVADMPELLRKRLPRYDAIPAPLIGRLARHECLRGERIGELLVADAVTRVLAVTGSIAAYAIVVDAKDTRARAFYEALGFLCFPSRPDRLFLPTATAAAAMTKAVTG